MFRKIKKPFDYGFSVSSDGVYVISIDASCKSGKLLELFGGEDLRLEIDDIKLRETPLGKRTRYFNIPPAWNGTKLKGKAKIVIFILKLNKGEHTIKFIPKRGAIINKEPEIKAFDSNKILENIQSEERNRQPWITIVLIDLPLKTLDVSVACEKRRLDSDDVKLIINNKIQENKQSSWWGKNWYWQGRRLRGSAEEVKFYPKLSNGIHYIEFWADRRPVLNWVNIDLSNKEQNKDKKKEEGRGENKSIQEYTYKGPAGKNNYNRYDSEIENTINFWNKKFLNDKYPVKIPLDPSLVKAIIYQESKVGYYPGGEIDVMQVGNIDDPAIKTLNGELEEWWISDGKQIRLNYKGKASANLPVNSIYWGVRWLYHKAQIITNDNKRHWRNWREAVFGYGPNTRKYENDVWKIYTKGIDPDGNILWEKNKNGFSLIKTLLFIGFMPLLFFGGYYFGEKFYNDYCDTKEHNKYQVQAQEKEPSPEEANSIVKEIFLENLEEYKKEQINFQPLFKESVDKCEELNCAGSLIFPWYYNDLVEYMQSDRQFIEAASSLRLIGKTYKRDIDNDGENEIIFSRVDLPNRQFVSFSIIDKINGEYSVIEKKIDGGYDGYIELLDFSGDLRPEIAFHVSFGKGGDRLHIFQHQRGNGFRKIFEETELFYSKYTFMDKDEDGKIEIKVNGEKRYTEDHGKKIQKIYEYDPGSNTFIL